jgi:hypothetical protein
LKRNIEWCVAAHSVAFETAAVVAIDPDVRGETIICTSRVATSPSFGGDDVSAASSQYEPASWCTWAERPVLVDQPARLDLWQVAHDMDDHENTDVTRSLHCPGRIEAIAFGWLTI